MLYDYHGHTPHGLYSFGCALYQVERNLMKDSTVS